MFFYQIRSKKSFKTRQNTQYGGGTSSYSLVQGGVPYIDGFLCHRAAVYVPTYLDNLFTHLISF